MKIYKTFNYILDDKKFPLLLEELQFIIARHDISIKIFQGTPLIRASELAGITDYFNNQDQEREGAPPTVDFTSVHIIRQVDNEDVQIYISEKDLLFWELPNVVCDKKYLSALFNNAEVTILGDHGVVACGTPESPKIGICRYPAEVFYTRRIQEIWQTKEEVMAALGISDQDVSNMLGKQTLTQVTRKERVYFYLRDTLPYLHKQIVIKIPPSRYFYPVDTGSMGTCTNICLTLHNK